MLVGPPHPGLTLPRHRKLVSVQYRQSVPTGRTSFACQEVAATTAFQTRSNCCSATFQFVCGLCPAYLRASSPGQGSSSTAAGSCGGVAVCTAGYHCHIRCPAHPNAWIVSGCVPVTRVEAAVSWPWCSIVMQLSQQHSSWIMQKQL